MTFRFPRMCAFGAAAIGLLLSSAGQACERCQRPSNHSCSCQRDDRGLLDMVDSLAGNLHRSVKGFAGSACDKKPACGCDACQTKRRVEPKRRIEPNCGAEPNCGVEATCGCELQGSCSHCQPAPKLHYHSQPTAPQSPAWIPPVPTPVPNHNAIPIPAPLPDSMVDPFQDEDAAPRRVPARAIQYRRSVSAPSQNGVPSQSPDAYGRRFDDQAGAVTFRISDDYVAQVPRGVVSEYAARAEGNHNRPVDRRPIQSRPVQHVRGADEAVVPVSGQRPASSSTGLHPSNNELPLRVVPVTPSPEASPYYNPLR